MEHSVIMGSATDRGRSFSCDVVTSQTELNFGYRYLLSVY